MDREQKRSRRRPKRPATSSEEPQETARVDERGGVLRVQRSTSSEVAEAVDEAGAPVFVERVRTQVHSSDSPVGGESPQSERRVPQTSDVEYVDEDFELPEPKTETQTEEYEDEEGRRVVVTTTITTTYEQTEDEEGNTVILERVHRRVQRTVYIDGEAITEQLEEPSTPKPKDTGVVYVDEDFQIPEPSETTTVQEYIDEEGRRVVVKTITRTTYEETADDDGCPVILEKVQKKVQRTVYVDGEIVEETIDMPEGAEEEIELPPSSVREEVEEQVDELGRKVVIRSVYTTTYEQDSDADGNIVILERVQKRVFRTVFVDGKEVIEEDPVPARKQSVEYVLELPESKVEEKFDSYLDENGKKCTIKTIIRTTYEEGKDDDGTPVILEKIHTTRITYVDGQEVVEELPALVGDHMTMTPGGTTLPEPKVTEEERTYTDELGRTVVEKTIITTTYQKGQDNEGRHGIIEHVHRRVIKTIYVDGEIVEVVREPSPEPTAQQKLVDGVELSVKRKPPQTKTVLLEELKLPEPSVIEDVVERTEPDGRRVVIRTITTTSYSSEKLDTGELVVYETVHRRVIRTVYSGEEIIEVVEEPTSPATVTKKTPEQMAEVMNQSLNIDDIELPESKTEEHEEESVDEQGRRVVSKISTTTSYEKQSDGDGNIVILEKVNRRVRRIVYEGDKVVEEIEEPDSVNTMQRPKQTEVARQTTSAWTKELKLPEPSTLEDIVEHTEADGRRVVTRTITTTTYSAETFETGEVIIYEKVECRITRTVYLGDQIVEEVEEPKKEPTITKKTVEELEQILKKGSAMADVPLPEPKVEEETEEHVEDDGRRIVIKTVTTTTYEKEIDDDGSIVILENVQRRIFKTVYIGEELIEEVEEPDTVTNIGSQLLPPTGGSAGDDPSGKTEKGLQSSKVEEITLPAPSTEEDIVEHTEPDGRRIVTKTIMTTTYEVEEVAGELVIYEKIQRRVIRTIYIGENVVEESEEPCKEPVVAKKTRAEVLALVQKDAAVVDVELPEPKTEETTEERIDDEGRRIVTKTVTTTTCEKSADDEGTVVILEKVQRRIFRTVYIGDEIIEEVEEPDTLPDMKSTPTPVPRSLVSTATKELSEVQKLQRVEGDNQVVTLPEPVVEETTEEYEEDDGRRIVVHTITTTTYDKREEDGSLVIVERVQKRVRKTIYVDGELVDIIEELHGSADESSSAADDAPALIEWNEESDTTADTYNSEPATPVKVPGIPHDDETKSDAKVLEAESLSPRTETGVAQPEKLPDEDLVIVHKLEEFIRYMPALSGKLVDEPQVDEEEVEKIENGRKVTYKYITITVIEERIDTHGRPHTVKRLVKHVIKTTLVDGKPLVEESCEPEIVEEIIKDDAPLKREVREPEKIVTPEDRLREDKQAPPSDAPNQTADSVVSPRSDTENIVLTQPEPQKSRETIAPVMLSTMEKSPVQDAPAEPENSDVKAAKNLDNKEDENAVKVSPKPFELNAALDVTVQKPWYDKILMDRAEEMYYTRVVRHEMDDRETNVTTHIESVPATRKDTSDTKEKHASLEKSADTSQHHLPCEPFWLDTFDLFASEKKYYENLATTNEPNAEETDRIPIDAQMIDAEEPPKKIFVDTVTSFALHDLSKVYQLRDAERSFYEAKEAMRSHELVSVPAESQRDGDAENALELESPSLQSNEPVMEASDTSDQNLALESEVRPVEDISNVMRKHFEHPSLPDEPPSRKEALDIAVAPSVQWPEAEKQPNLDAVSGIYETVQDQMKYSVIPQPNTRSSLPDIEELMKEAVTRSIQEEHLRQEGGKPGIVEPNRNIEEPATIEKPQGDDSLTLGPTLCLEEEGRPVEDISNIMKTRFDQPSAPLDVTVRAEPTNVAIEPWAKWPEAEKRTVPVADDRYQTVEEQMLHTMPVEDKELSSLPDVDELIPRAQEEKMSPSSKEVHDLPELERPMGEDESLHLVLGRLVQRPVVNVPDIPSKKSEAEVIEHSVEWPPHEKRPDTVVWEIRADVSPTEMMAHQPLDPGHQEPEGLPPLSEILDVPRRHPETALNGVNGTLSMPAEETTQVCSVISNPDAGKTAQVNLGDQPLPDEQDGLAKIGPEETTRDPQHDTSTVPKYQAPSDASDDPVINPAVVESDQLMDAPSDKEAPRSNQRSVTEPDYADDSDVIDSALADVTGVIVEKPKVEAYVEETVDSLGRKVVIRRVFVTVVEEIIDRKGAKVIVSRVIKKQKRITSQDGADIVEVTDIGDCKAEGTERQPHDAVLEHDMQYSMMHEKPHATNDTMPSTEPIKEPLTDLDDQSVVTKLCPSSREHQVGEPTVERDITETVDQHGRKVTFVRVYVTVWEEVVLKSGQKVVQKRQISRAQKITHTPKGQVVESIDPTNQDSVPDSPDAAHSSDTDEESSETSPGVEPETPSLSSKTDEELVQSIVPATLSVVGTPEVERFEKVIVDERGRSVKVVRVYITIVEEVITETGTRKLVKRRISKTQKTTTDADGKPSIEESESSTVIDPSPEATDEAKTPDSQVASELSATRKGSGDGSLRDVEQTDKITGEGTSRNGTQDTAVHLSGKSQDKRDKKKKKAKPQESSAPSESLDPKKVEEELLQLLLAPSKEEKKRKPRKKGKKKSSDTNKASEQSQLSKEMPIHSDAPAPKADQRDLIVEVQSQEYGHAVLVTHFDDVEHENKESDHETYFKDDSTPAASESVSEGHTAPKKKKHKKKKRTKSKDNQAEDEPTRSHSEESQPVMIAIEGSAEPNVVPDDGASTVSSHDTTEDSSSLKVDSHRRPRRKSRNRSKSPRPVDTELDDLVRMIEDPNVHPELPPPEEFKKPADVPKKHKRKHRVRSKSPQMPKHGSQARPSTSSESVDQPDEALKVDSTSSSVEECNVDTVTEPNQALIDEAFTTFEEADNLKGGHQEESVQQKSPGDAASSKTDVEVAEEAVEAVSMPESQSATTEQPEYLTKASIKSKEKTKENTKSNEITNGASLPHVPESRPMLEEQCLLQSEDPIVKKSKKTKKKNKAPKLAKNDNNTQPDSKKHEELLTSSEPTQETMVTEGSNEMPAAEKAELALSDSIEVAEEAFETPGDDRPDNIEHSATIETPSSGVVLTETVSPCSTLEFDEQNSLREPEVKEEEGLVSELVSQVKGKLIGEPKIEVETEREVDNHGRSVSIRRIRVIVIEEVIDERGLPITRRRVLRKTMKVIGDAADPIIEETKHPEEVELVRAPQMQEEQDASSAVYRVTSEITRLSDEPSEDETTVNEYVDDQGRLIKVRKIVQTVTDRDGDGRQVQRLVTKIVRMVVLNGEEIPMVEAEEDSSIQALEFDVQKRPAMTPDSSVIEQVHVTSCDSQVLDREDDLPASTNLSNQQRPVVNISKSTGLPLSASEVCTAEKTTSIEDTSIPAEEHGKMTASSPMEEFVVVDYQEPVETATTSPDFTEPEEVQGLSKVQLPETVVPDVGVSAAFEREGAVPDMRKPTEIGHLVLTERDAIAGTAQQSVEESAWSKDDSLPRATSGTRGVEGVPPIPTESCQTSLEKESPLEMNQFPEARQAVEENSAQEHLHATAPQAVNSSVPAEEQSVLAKETVSALSEPVVTSTASNTSTSALETVVDPFAQPLSKEPNDVLGIASEYAVSEMQQAVEDTQGKEDVPVPEVPTSLQSQQQDSDKQTSRSDGNESDVPISKPIIQEEVQEAVCEPVRPITLQTVQAITKSDEERSTMHDKEVVIDELDEPAVLPSAPPAEAALVGSIIPATPEVDVTEKQPVLEQSQVSPTITAEEQRDLPSIDSEKSEHDAKSKKKRRRPKKKTKDAASGGLLSRLTGYFMGGDQQKEHENSDGSDVEVVDIKNTEDISPESSSANNIQLSGSPSEDFEVLDIPDEATTVLENDPKISLSEDISEPVVEQQRHHQQGTVTQPAETHLYPHVEEKATEPTSTTKKRKRKSKKKKTTGNEDLHQGDVHQQAPFESDHIQVLDTLEVNLKKEMEVAALNDVLGTLDTAPITSPDIETRVEEGVDDFGRKVVFITVFITVILEDKNINGETTYTKQIYKKIQKTTTGENGEPQVENINEQPIIISDLRSEEVNAPIKTHTIEQKHEDRLALEGTSEVNAIHIKHVPEMTESAVIEECLPTSRGAVVGEPGVETTVEEKLDEQGRPVKFKRIYVTIIEEIMDDTGAKRIVKRVVKKTQKLSEVNGKTVTEDVEEPVEEPSVEELEKQILDDVLPDKASLVGEPKVETIEEKSVNDHGKPVIVKRFVVTIYENVPAENGKTVVVRKILKKVRKVSEVDGKPVVEEYEEPQETETLMESMPEATEASVMEECLPVSEGIIVGEPKVETVVEEKLDEQGRPVKFKRIYVTIIEEIVDDTGVKRTVKRVVKKTQKLSQVNGETVTEDVEEPIKEPSVEELEKQILDDVLPDKASLVGEPKVETIEEKSVDDQGKTVILKRSLVTIYQNVPAENGKTTVVRRILKKVRKVSEVDGKPVVEEYEEPQEAETLMESMPEATEASVIEECLPVSKGIIVGEPKVETVVEEKVDEQGRPVKFKRIYVTIIEEIVDDTGVKRTVKRVVKKTQKLSEVNGKTVAEDLEEPIEEPSVEELEKQILDDVLPDKASLVGEPKVETIEEKSVDDQGKPVILKRSLVTIYQNIPAENGKTTVVRRILKKVRKVSEVDGKPVVEEYDEPQETETLMESMPEATEASVIEECLPVSKGAIVGEPKVETVVEEKVDEQGRPVKFRRIYVTIIEEIVEDTGAKRTVKRVVKKTQKLSEVNGKTVTEDVEEPIEESSVEDLEKRILHDLLEEKDFLVNESCTQFVDNRSEESVTVALEQPVVQTQICELFENGVPVSMHTFTVTVPLETCDPSEGRRITKKTYRHYHRVFRLDDKSVTEEYGDPPEVELVAQSVPEVDEPQVVAESLSLVSGCLVGDPKTQTDVEETTDRGGNPLTFKTVRVSLLEEVTDPAGDKHLVSKQVKRSQTVRHVLGRPVVTDVLLPEPLPSSEEVLASWKLPVSGRLLTEPKVEVVIEDCQDSDGRPVSVRRYVVTVLEEVVEPSGNATTMQKTFTKIIRSHEVGGKLVTEEWTQPETSQVLSMSRPEVPTSWQDDLNAVLSEVSGDVLEKPEATSSMEDSTDERGLPCRMRRTVVTLFVRRPDSDIVERRVVTRVTRFIFVDGALVTELLPEVDLVQPVGAAVDTEPDDEAYVARVAHLMRGKPKSQPDVLHEVTEETDAAGRLVTVRRVLVTLLEEVRRSGRKTTHRREVPITRRTCRVGATTVLLEEALGEPRDTTVERAEKAERSATTASPPVPSAPPAEQQPVRKPDLDDLVSQMTSTVLGEEPTPEMTPQPTPEPAREPTPEPVRQPKLVQELRPKPAPVVMSFAPTPVTGVSEPSDKESYASVVKHHLDEAPVQRTAAGTVYAEPPGVTKEEPDTVDGGAATDEPPLLEEALNVPLLPEDQPLPVLAQAFAALGRPERAVSLTALPGSQTARAGAAELRAAAAPPLAAAPTARWPELLPLWETTLLYIVGRVDEALSSSALPEPQLSAQAEEMAAAEETLLQLQQRLPRLAQMQDQERRSVAALLDGLIAAAREARRRVPLRRRVADHSLAPDDQPAAADLPLESVQRWLREAASAGPSERSELSAEAESQLHGPAGPLWKQVLTGRAEAGGAEGALILQFPTVMSLLEQPAAPVPADPPALHRLSAQLAALPGPEHSPLPADSLPDLRALSQLWRRLVALLHRQLPAGDPQLHVRQLQLSQLSAARALWEVLDAELAQLDEWREQCDAELTRLLGDTSTDDTQLVPRLEELCSGAAERFCRLRHLRPLLARLQRLVTARSCRLQLTSQEAQLDRLRARLETSAGRALALQLRMLTVRENSARVEEWVRRVRKAVPDEGEEPTEEQLTEQEELRAQLETMEHLGAAAADELDAALATLTVSDEELQRSLLAQTGRWLAEQAARLRAADRAAELGWLERRTTATLAAADRADELAPVLAAMETVRDQLSDWERRAARAEPAADDGDDPVDSAARLEAARRVSRAALLGRRLGVRLAALRPVADQLAAVRAAEMELYRRLMLLELLAKAGSVPRSAHVPQLQAEVGALHRLVAALKKKHPHCHAAQVTETEIVQLMARLRSLKEEHPLDLEPVDPELMAAVDQLTALVAELEALRAQALPRPDATTIDELETKAAAIQLAHQQLIAAPAEDAETPPEGTPAAGLAARGQRQREEAAEAVAEAADQCRAAALLWQRLLVQLQAALSWLQAAEPTADQRPSPFTEQLPQLRHTLGGCRQLLDQLSAGGQAAPPALSQLSAQLAEAAGRLDAVAARLTVTPEQTAAAARDARLLDGVRLQLRQLTDSRRLPLPLLAEQLAAAVEVAQQLRQLSVTAATAELRADAAALLMDWESARVSLLLARYDDQLTAVVAEDTPAAEAVHEAVFDQLMRPAPTEVYGERPELTAEVARVQTADRLLGLHRDRLAAGLAAEEPAGPRAAALGRQLALVLRLLARLRGRHALLAGTLHGRALTWLRGLETELLRLRRRPLAAGQLSALRRQLAALERQLPRGEQLLAALRRAAGPAAADTWCAPLESRLAELTADLGAWSAYVSYVSAGWRRQQQAAAEAAAELQRLERLPAGGAAAEEETAALAALEGHLDEADRQRAALNGALTPEDERTAAAAAGQLRARLLLLRLLMGVSGQTEADKCTSRKLARTNEELHSDWLERKSAAVRGQGQTSLCTLLTYLQNELPAQLLTASGDCDQLERERAARLDKINSLLETVADFEQMTPALEAKLAKIELILDEPVEFETGDKKEHHAATKKNDEMLELVRDVSRKMGDISGLCDLLMSDTDGLPEAREVRTVTQGGGHLQQRWSRICELSAGRRQRIADAWSSAGQLGRELREFESRLSAAEERLAGAAPSAELVPRDRVRTDLETVSRAAEELEQQAAAARGVSRLLRAGLRRRHLAADGALAEGAAAATGRWLQLREQAERAAERLRKHAAVQEHTDSDWAELESGAEQLHERARLLLLEANAGGLLNGPAKLAELTADRDTLAARLDSVTRDTVSLLQTTAPEEASSYDLRPPSAYHRLTEAFGELHSALGAEGEEETDAAADPLSRATDEADSCLSRLEELLAAESPAVPELAQTLGACSSAADLVGSLSHQRPEGAEPRAAAVRERYERLRTAAHGRLHAAEEAPLQWELDRWRLQQWLQHTANKLDNMPSAESLRKDDVQLRRFNRLCVELEAHTELLAAVVSAGHQLPEGAATGSRPVRQRLTELQTEWDAVCGRLVALQSELLSIAPPDDGDAAAESGDEEARRGLLARTATLMWRVARVALPVQALLLLGLAVMALYGDRDADCASGANNFAASMQTMLNYPDGGPPM